MGLFVEVPISDVGRHDEELAIADLPFGRAFDLVAGKEQALDKVSVVVGGGDLSDLFDREGERQAGDPGETGYAVFSLGTYPASLADLGGHLCGAGESKIPATMSEM
ncbi:hypothetical protein AB0945_36280 [Streptomyces sp. NPDC005474]|uniref:hypothetical protein n=1 Tax=Streptomyces sp. NPDC005474 TaxID=3154878 RepID=UPI0034531740